MIGKLTDLLLASYTHLIHPSISSTMSLSVFGMRFTA
jgi:hypothetical protein